MNHLLVFECGHQSEVKLTESSYLLGRSRECNIRLKSRSISRVHALLVRIEDEYYIHDGNPRENKPSTGGTFLWDKKSESWEKITATKLQHGDRIRLSPDVVFQYLKISFDETTDGDTSASATVT